MAPVEMIRFIPQTLRYSIYYPKNYELQEDEDGIVVISSVDTESAMTISGYEVEGEMDSKVLTDFFADITFGYNLMAGPELGEFGEGIKIEGTYTKERDYWLWKIVSLNNAIIVISINSSEKLNQEQLNLYDFMLENMEIYQN